jgi:alkylation response protein AidB-like acyl-CoA dehydrogenase
VSGGQTLPALRTRPGTGRLEPHVAEAAVRAEAVDRGDGDVRAALSGLGAAGLLSLGVHDGVHDDHDAGGGDDDGVLDGSLADQATVIRSLARACMSTAFATWAQRMAIGYLARWGTDGLRPLLAELVAGTRPGATAMATAFQDALGLREVPVTLQRHGDEVVLDGTVPWASNLFPGGAVVVLPARSADGGRAIVAITTDLDGVELRPYPPLLALGSTASTSVRLEGVRVPASWVLTTRYLDFLADVRPAFLLLQTAFCLGLTDASLAGAAGRFDGAAVVLAADHDDLVARRDHLDRRHRTLLAGGGPAGTGHVELRLAAGLLAVDATRHEATVRGGAGYLAGSPVARRLREAAFLPIQSPTEAQLRWELSRSA